MDGAVAMKRAMIEWALVGVPVKGRVLSVLTAVIVGPPIFISSSPAYRMFIGLT